MENEPSGPQQAPAPRPAAAAPAVTVPAAASALAEKLPSWYREIFPAGPRDGFFEKIGQHSLSFVERSPDHLVVTFDNLSDAGYPGYDREPWAGKFIRERGDSHLGVYAQGPTWFRDARFIARMEKLRDDGFFARFRRVTFSGTSMGAFAALIFADLAPGANVLAFSPQSTLAADLVPWESRFVPGRKQDWSLPRSDAACHLAGAGKVWVIYDPFLEVDSKQVARLPAGSFEPLHAFGLGHKTALVLRRMEKLKPVMGAGLDGTLTPALFYRLIRNRGEIYLYRKVMEEHLTRRGHGARIPALVAAFRRRVRRSKAAGNSTGAADPAEGDPAEALLWDDAGPDGFGDGSGDGFGDEPPQPRVPQPPLPQPPLSQRPLSQPEAMPSTTALPPARPEPAPGPLRRDGPAGARPPRRPRSIGNVWQLSDDGTRLRYLSDQYAGRVIGFEERDGIALAETPEVALGMIAVGGGVNLPRPLPERFDYHVTDEALDRNIAAYAATAQAVAALRLAGAAGRAWRSVIALSEPLPGMMRAEIAPGAPVRRRLAARIAAARAALAGRGKTLFVDRIRLDLLAGEPGLDAATAMAHYTDTIAALRDEVAIAAGQSSRPLVVLSQSAGSRDDGRAETILAEGLIETAEPRLGTVVATPRYPFRLLDDTPTTLAAEDQMLVDELEARAIEAVQNGRPWYCPALRQLRWHGDRLVASFSALGDLDFAPGVAPEPGRGFRLEGMAGDIRIAGAEVRGRDVLLTLNRAPEGAAPALSYAFGHRGDRGDGGFANRGALREAEGFDSLMLPGRKLFRHALAGRLALMRIDD
ncbi:hypothetical protein [Paenirhodobacter enshiensis]|uniref:hypothetical protein n=1 Tax=Paenirhodobacter enshiensis TaxID=1105367 RepID=UPI0035B426AB